MSVEGFLWRIYCTWWYRVHLSLKLIYRKKGWRKIMATVEGNRQSNLKNNSDQQKIKWRILINGILTEKDRILTISDITSSDLENLDSIVKKKKILWVWYHWEIRFFFLLFSHFTSFLVCFSLTFHLNCIQF